MTQPSDTQTPATNDLAPERQLDWFIGEWDVQSRIRRKDNWAENQCQSTVEPVLDGQALLERFWGQLGEQPIQAISLRKYSPRNERWEQAWVDNNSPQMALYVGHFAEGQFVGRNRASLEDPDATRHFRETFFDIEDNAFSWKLDVSENGETWQTIWEMRYTRR